ncbi:hypothetical protein MYSE111917_15610 [Mycobacterium senriense]
MPDDSDAVTTWVRYPQQRAFAAAFDPVPSIIRGSAPRAPRGAKRP